MIEAGGGRDLIFDRERALVNRWPVNSSDMPVTEQTGLAFLAGRNARCGYNVVSDEHVILTYGLPADRVCLRC